MLYTNKGASALRHDTRSEVSLEDQSHPDKFKLTEPYRTRHSGDARSPRAESSLEKYLRSCPTTEKVPSYHLTMRGSII